VAEMKAFVFAVVFIVVFAGLVSTIPTDFLGAGADPDVPVFPVNPNLLTDFTDSETFQKSDFVANLYWYPATLGGYEFLCGFLTDSFAVSAKSKFFGIWFGAMSAINWVNENGTEYWGGVSFTDITNDAEDGVVSYTLIFQGDGTFAGNFLFYWNTTAYTGPSDAWDNNGLYLLHGVGITANTDVVSLLISLLFLQLPDCPFLVNLLLVTPIWASIIYVLWFIIKESLPFV